MNALAESTIGLYKTELIKLRGPWKTIDQVELATLEWVDWYNHRRLHGACDGLPPVEYEQTRERQITQYEPSPRNPGRFKRSVEVASDAWFGW